MKNRTENTKKILIADDEAHILDVLEYTLKQHGFETYRAQNGKQAIEIFEKENPALAILDINMPPPDGLDVLKEIRNTSNIPVIFLTSRDEEIDRIVGLEVGADDYVTKPFSPRELAARIKAIFRRTQKIDSKAGAPLEYGPLKLDEDRYLLLVNNEPVNLGKVEFNLMRILIKHPGKVFSRDSLMDLAWGKDYIATDRVIDTHIKRIRQKVLEIDKTLDAIETVHGVGYKLKEL